LNGALPKLLSAFSALIVLSLVGCASGTSPVSSSPVGPAPLIASQPANQSVPMGLTGTFTVQVYGTNLQYQWSRNGSLISGATASTYTTPATAFSDTGAIFTVTITNISGSITSNPATLTVTARAPKAGDLRFQQVDAASTINGYAVQPSIPLGCPPPGGGGQSEYGVGTGTPFFLTNGTGVFQLSSFALPSGITGLETAYSVVPMQSYQNILSAPPSYFGFPGPNDPSSVVTSLSFLPADNCAALAFIHSETSSGFIPTKFTVPASSLQAYATQEGLAGHVLTAISYDGTQATGFSYSWTGDPSAVYEAEVVFATLDTATAQARPWPPVDTSSPQPAAPRQPTAAESSSSEPEFRATPCPVRFS
jgi:hypothetical protein